MAMRNRLVVGASLLVLLAMASAEPAWARWGCGARSPTGAVSHNGGEPSEAAAKADALEDCKKVSGKTCHIISCDPNIDTIEQSRVKWPLPPSSPGAREMHCGPAFGNKC
jgi:hypothetical protein